MKEAIARVFPVGVALAPIGLLFGVLAAQANWAPMDVFLLSTIGFTGSGQFAFLGFSQQGIHTVRLAVVFLVILSMNLRYIPMSFSASQPLQAPKLYKAILSHCLADESYATERQTDDIGSRAVIRFGIFLSWVISTTAGCYLSAFLPSSISQTLTGLTFPVSAILFALSAINIIGYTGHVRPQAKTRFISILFCSLVAVGSITLLGEKYFWIPSIFLCYLILIKLRGGTENE